jgi:hypothetical protein
MNAFSRTFLPVFLGLSLGSLVAADATPNQPLPEEAVRAAAAKIDALVAKVCEANGVKRNDPIDDEAFVRRIYLDLVGRVPSIAETRDFIDSTYAAKRERLIESLLGTEGYVSHSYNYWADILRVNEKLGNNDATNEAAYRLWIKDALRRNKPYDQFVKELVSATGHVWENGAIGYYSRDRGMPLDNMANTVRIFLGTRLECAQCHNHPFDKWTQLDFYGMAAFSSGMEGNRYEFPNRSALSASARKENGRARDEAMKEIRRKLEAEIGTKDKAALRAAYQAEVKKLRESGGVAKRKEKGDESLKLVMNELYKPLRYTTIAENDKPLKLPHDYQYDDAKPGDLVPASTMFGAVVEAAEGGSNIQAYAEWMTSSENPTFTKVVVNRLWKRLFGHAIIEPLDELTDQSVSTNPELVAYLEELMKELKYDMRAFTGILANTSTYQRAATTAELEPGTPYYFQGPLLRRLSAEQVWDSALTLLIDHPDQYKPSLERDIAKIEQQKQIYESLEEIPFDDYQALVERLSVEIGDRSKVAEEKRKESIAARAAGDEEKARELSREVRQAQSQVEKTMKREAFSAVNPGADKEELHTVFGVTDALLRDSILDEGKLEASSDEMSGEMTRKERRARMQAKAKRKPAAKGKGSRKEAPERELGTLARASEIAARPGSFLRTFGQSDREVIENASDEATVPQALELLNGPVAAAVADPGSVLGRELVKAETPEAKIRAIYTAMLSRAPKEKEVSRILEEVAAKGDGAYDDAVWAVLNSTQFLYIR